MNDGARRWKRLEELFERLVELEPDARAPVLEEECADDPVLRLELLSLLASDGRGDDGIERVVEQAFAEVDAVDSEPAGVGRRIGPYRTIRLLGTGGMGSVYLAERDDATYEAQVAVKLLRAPLVDTDVAGRFRAERQILANLHHPGIAGLLDGGAADDGTPYLVMEYVEGDPIDEHCRKHGLSVDGRLRLFRKVCAAVQYAHGRLVVHRDIKPANILVTADGEPRLLDFGIAKLIGEAEGATAAGLTRTGLRPMTPTYASPEQVRGEAITTATDVYALGALLYELLTGTPPFGDAANGRGFRSPGELEKAILERDPEPPSGAMERPSVTSTGIPESTLDRARREVGQDLDTVVLKALQKDPLRRYDSVDQLSEDVGRFLDGLPVRARPDTWSYRTRKFVRRNRGMVVGSLSGFMTVLMFAIGSAVQAIQLQRQRDAARLERDRASAVSDFLVSVFQSSDPDESKGEDITAREILANGGLRVRDELADQPEVQLAVMGAIGTVYRSLGAYDSAAVFLQEAVDKARETSGEGSVEYATALVGLASLERLRGGPNKARELDQEALEIRRDKLGPDDVLTAETWNNLGAVDNDLGHYEKAEKEHLEALRIRREQLGENHSFTATSLDNLSTLYVDMGRYEEAVDYARRALSVRRKLFPEENMDIARSLNNLGSALEYAGRLDEAEPNYLESLEIRRKLLPAGHPSIFVVESNLAGLYMKEGEYERATSQFRVVVEAFRKIEDDPVGLARSLNNLGVALTRSGHADQAVRALQESDSLVREALGPDTPMLAYMAQGLGDAYVRLGKDADAEQSYRDALALRRRVLSDDNPNIAFTADKLGTFLLDRGRLDEAGPLIEEALETRKRVLEPDHPDVVDSMIQVALLRRAEGRADDARELLEQAESVAVKARGEDDAGAVKARKMLADSLGVEAP